MGHTAVVTATVHRLSGLYAPSLRGRLSANTAAMQRAPDTMQHYTVITIYTATTRWQQPWSIPYGRSLAAVIAGVSQYNTHLPQ